MQATAAFGFSNFTSFNLCKEFAQIPFCFDAKKPIRTQKFVQLLAAQEGNLSRTITVCATSGNNGEPEESCTTACTNFEVLADTEKCENSRDAGNEVVAPTLYSSTDLNFKAKNLDDQDNLFDKLKAVHLHILAMEQWNASRLKLCHRYVFLLIEITVKSNTCIFFCLYTLFFSFNYHIYINESDLIPSLKLVTIFTSL